MQRSVGELEPDIGGATPILKDSKECFVLLLLLFCPVTRGNGTSNPWIREEKKKKSVPPSSFTGKSPLDLLFSRLFNCPFFISNEDGEQVLDSATALAYGTCSGCREPQGKGKYNNHGTVMCTAPPHPLL